jgi:hypothetical protein
MLNSDLAGDSDIVASCAGLGAGNFYDPGPGLSCERIVSADNNVAITNHIQTVPVEGKPFTVKQYVTWVDNSPQGGPDQDYKRLSVVVEWNDNGTTDSFETSTLLSRARRGLPVPEFDLTPDTQTKQVEAGQTVAFAHSIENLGIIDAYDIEMPVPLGWTVQFYADDQTDGEIGVYDPAFDEALTDTNGTGTPDTDNVDTDEVFYLLAVVTVPATQPTGTVDVPLTATSGIKDDVTETSENKAKVAPLGIRLYLYHNPHPPVANTTAQNQLLMNTTAPVATTLYKYSTNLYNPVAAHGGRWLPKLASTPAATESNTSRYVNWIYQVPTTTVYQGNGSVRLWIAARDQNCSAVSLHYYLRRKNNATSNNASQTTVLNEGNLTVAGGGVAPCDFTQVDVPFILTPVSIPSNNIIELKVVVNSISAADALVAYDTTLHPSRLFLPLAAL